ncbi:type VI secretion system Vgr family protein [Schlesneria paludicola]|uniref:type VI secretion system Vgr family protein n=1 Tax=Schlesneria paludicola TaxID=360056 RepID=UPI00029AE217|nr:type VI secretion system tip protein TssI/VgrG [Schlesneria paludicola]
MSAKYTDKNRLLSFKADGKTDFLFPTKFSATELMSGLFSVRVELMVDVEKADQVQGDQLLGKRMTLKASLGRDYDKGPYRYFDGVCSRFASVEKDDRFAHFEVELVPWMWLLTKRSDFRIYQDLNIPDILDSVFGDLQKDFSDFKYEIRANRGQYKKIDYCVQFRESQFSFVSRLMEQDGIYYYFEHTDSGHKLIIDDSPTAGGDVPNQAEVSYIKESGPGEFKDDNITTWREDRVIHSGKFSVRDYHSQLAQNKIEISGVAAKTSIAKNDKLEVYNWQGGSALRYNKTDQRLDEVNSVGSTLTNIRAQQSEVTHHTFSGTGCCRGFVPGYRFSLKHASGKKYLLVEIQHQGVQDPSYETGQDEQVPYTNAFTSISSDLQFRPQRVTPKPVVEGLESAKVVGKSGEEIWIDKYGRVRVQFFWDRKGESNEKSTCWVRVAQLSAGKRWGASFWPRVGQEVLVAFVEGDPDQPVIVGSVYNNQQMPPYLGDGPDDKHKVDPDISGIKTNSTKGGNGYNELRFCDTKDKEQVFIHAEKDMDVRVKNERRETTIADHVVIVGDPSNSESGSYKQRVHRNHSTLVMKDKFEKVEGNVHIAVGEGSNSDGGKYQHSVEKDSLEYVGGNKHVAVKGSRSESVTGQYSLTLGQLDAKIDQGAALEATTSLHLKAMTIVIEADLQLSLKVGGNFVDLSPAGVAINGMPMVMINSGGAAGAGPGAQPATAEAADGLKTPPDSYFHKADDSKTGTKSCD